ncbi:hypothetical protein Leryth_020929, partial [Lithospermum erythrorhizon]
MKISYYCRKKISNNVYTITSKQSNNVHHLICPKSYLKIKSLKKLSIIYNIITVSCIVTKDK